MAEIPAEQFAGHRQPLEAGGPSPDVTVDIETMAHELLAMAAAKKIVRLAAESAPGDVGCDCPTEDHRGNCVWWRARRWYAEFDRDRINERKRQAMSEAARHARHQGGPSVEDLPPT